VASSPLADLLGSLGLAALRPALEAEDLELDELALLTDLEWRELGVSLGHRKRIQAALVERGFGAVMGTSGAGRSGDPASGGGVSDEATTLGGAPGTSEPTGGISDPITAVGGKAPAPTGRPRRNSAGWGAGDGGADRGVSDPPTEGGGPAAAPTARPTLHVGRVLEPFTLVGRLGAGSFGEVWEATDSHGGKRCALKIVASAGPAQLAAGALVQEFSVLRNVKDRTHVVTAERPRTEVLDGQRLLVLPMELADGGTLRDWMVKRPVPADGTDPASKRLRAALDLFAQACAGVQALHDANVVHLDLKPANLLLVGGVLKVADFGLSRDLSRLSAVQSQLLSDGVGTPTYMAPEQFEAARPEDVSPAADVWALGVILYELLDGKPPFSADSAKALERKILKRSLAPSLRRVPERFHGVVARCLSREEDKRPDSAMQLAREVEAAGAALAPRTARLEVAQRVENNREREGAEARARREDEARIRKIVAEEESAREELAAAEAEQEAARVREAQRTGAVEGAQALALRLGEGAAESLRDVEQARDRLRWLGDVPAAGKLRQELAEIQGRVAELRGQGGSVASGLDACDSLSDAQEALSRAAAGGTELVAARTSFEAWCGRATTACTRADPSVVEGPDYVVNLVLFVAFLLLPGGVADLIGPGWGLATAVPLILLPLFVRRFPGWLRFVGPALLAGIAYLSIAGSASTGLLGYAVVAVLYLLGGWYLGLRSFLENRRKERLRRRFVLEAQGVEMIVLPVRASLDRRATALSTSPITQAQFQSFLDACPEHPEPLGWARPTRDQAELPVVQVTWADAAAYCDWGGGRVPTNNELNRASGWERFWLAPMLAGFGENSRGQADRWDRPPPTLEQTWCAENSEGRPHPVGSRQANRWGFTDLRGGVWEWAYTGGDPNGTGGGPTLQSGGSFRTPLAELGGQWSWREASPDEVADDVGFRLAMVRPEFSESADAPVAEARETPAAEARVPRRRAGRWFVRGVKLFLLVGLLAVVGRWSLPATGQPLTEFDHALPSGPAIRMVRLPGGSFDMGSPKHEGECWGDGAHEQGLDGGPSEHGLDGGPVHIKLVAFSLGKTEVTNAQYAAFLTAHGSNDCLPPSGTPFVGDALAWCVVEGSNSLLLDKSGATWTPKPG